MPNWWKVNISSDNGLVWSTITWSIQCWLRSFCWNVFLGVQNICLSINSSSPSAEYMHQWTGSAIVQVMTCQLFGAKPLPETMLAYYQLDSWEQISVKCELKFYHFHSRKCIWNCHQPKMAPILSSGRWVKKSSRDISAFARSIG